MFHKTKKKECVIIIVPLWEEEKGCINQDWLKAQTNKTDLKCLKKIILIYYYKIKNV